MSIPDIPPAHLWRYDCGSSSAARATVRKRAATRPLGTATVALDPNAESVTAPEPTGSASGLDQGRDSTPAQTFAAPVVTSTAVESTPPGPPTPSAASSNLAAAAPVNAAISPAAGPAEHATASNLRLASASDSDTGTATAMARAPVDEVTVAHAPQGPTQDRVKLQGNSRDTISSPPVATPDDLSQVRAVDPQAAEHIASYCANSVQDAFIVDCRRREAEAWTRLVLQREFPTLDEATRKKCSEPPFPDTYVAKESCARYELRIN